VQALLLTFQGLTSIDTKAAPKRRLS
jgi:hypothetical protein